VGEPTDALVSIIAPAVACLADHGAAITLLERRGTIEDEAGLAAVLDELLAGATAIDVQQLIAEARAAGFLDDVRRGLGIEFAQFNAADEDSAASTSRSETRRVTPRRFATTQKPTARSLCSGCVAAFRDGRALDEYVLNRELRSLEPDPAWLDEHDVPPDELIAEHAARWVERFGDAPTPGAGSLLPVSALRPAKSRGRCFDSGPRSHCRTRLDSQERRDRARRGDDR
jgi:hypothetical protein